MKLKQKYRDVLEEQGWCVIDEAYDDSVEIGKYSPAGEDFSTVVEVDGDAFPDHVFDAAHEFDTEEHVEMLLEARRNGFSGVPDMETLVEDADAIQNMLYD